MDALDLGAVSIALIADARKPSIANRFVVRALEHELTSGDTRAGEALLMQLLELPLLLH
jgi:hypothetical protein